MGKQSTCLYKGSNDVLVVQTRQGQVCLVKFDGALESYRVKRTIDLFEERKDTYLFNCLFKGGRYYLSYINQF